MRRAILAGAVGFLALSLAAVALATASFRQIADIAFTTHHAGASTGIRSVISSSDKGAPAYIPKPARRLVLTFPTGTAFNLRTSSVAACTFSDAALQRPFGPSCPRRSEVGRGSARMNVEHVPGTVVRATVRAYLHRGASLIVVLYLNQNDWPGSAPIILHATASGPRLTLNLPKIVYGKGPGLPHGVIGVIVSLKLTTLPIGSGSGALVRAGRCTRHRFTIRSHFVYGDRTTKDVTSSSSCS